jgi:hypothetical protein
MRTTVPEGQGMPGGRMIFPASTVAVMLMTMGGFAAR